MKFILFALLVALSLAAEDRTTLYPGMTWQYNLKGKVNTNINAQVFSIDLFDVSKETIQELKNKGRFVICYVNVGSYEGWRPDAKDFPKSIIGKKMQGWDEYWFDIRKISAFTSIFEKRFRLAADKGCDAIEADNVDAYDNVSGFPITKNDQIKFNKWFAALAHEKGMKVGLKNALDIIPSVIDDFDFQVNEQCFQYNECENVLAFIKQGKPVFNVEYNLPASKFCSKARSMKLSSIKKNLDVQALPYESCGSATTLEDEEMSESDLFGMLYALHKARMPKRPTKKVNEAMSEAEQGLQYDRAVACTSGPTQGAKNLLALILSKFPGGTNGGIYNCRSVRGGKSVSLHGEGRAVDYMLNAHKPAQKTIGDNIVQFFTADNFANAKRYGVQEVIWNRKIWSANRATEGLRAYTGVASHEDHVHIGMNKFGAKSCCQ